MRLIDRDGRELAAAASALRDLVTVDDFIGVSERPDLSLEQKTYHLLYLAARASVVRDVEAALARQSEAANGNA